MAMEEVELQYLEKAGLEDYESAEPLRRRLSSHLSDQLFSDPADALTRDLHIKWWKLSYYKPIEHYRKLSKLKSDRSKWASAKLLQIIDEGIGVTLGLIRHLADKYQLTDFDEVFLSLGLPIVGEEYQARPAVPAEVYKLLYHLFVCAGDLARYKSQNSPTFAIHDQFAHARTFYLQAHACFPEVGHPYNMLAVIESQLGHPLDTIYYYVRSFSCREASKWAGITWPPS